MTVVSGLLDRTQYTFSVSGVNCGGVGVATTVMRTITGSGMALINYDRRLCYNKVVKIPRVLIRLYIMYLS